MSHRVCPVEWVPFFFQPEKNPLLETVDALSEDAKKEVLFLDKLPDFVSSPHSNHFREIDLGSEYDFDLPRRRLSNDELPLLTSKHNLQKLILGKPIDHVGVEYICKTAAFSSLRSLLMSDLTADADAIATSIASSSILNGLEEINLDWVGYYNDDYDRFGLTDAGLTRLVQSPNFQRVRSLSIVGYSITGEGMKAIGQSPHCASLRELDISNNSGRQLGRDAFQWLDQSQHLPEMTHITARDINADDECAELIASSPILSASLEHLDLSSNQITVEGAHAMARSSFFKKLRSLFLRGCQKIGDDGITALARAPWFSSLLHLDIECTTATDESIIEVLRAAPGLRSLKLSINAIGGDGVRALASSSLRSLQTLTLGGFNKSVDAAVLGAISSSPVFSTLRDLTIHFIDDNTVNTLFSTIAKAPQFANVEKIKAAHNREMTDEALVALARSPFLTSLKYLDLSNAKISDEGVLALAASPILSQLRELYLNNNQITDRGALALVNSPFLRRMEVVKIHANQFTDEGVRALRESPLISKARVLSLVERYFGSEIGLCVSYGRE
jgi:Ran GTPase-activating protein (RanGAP) involved in mRNA processing and transport